MQRSWRSVHARQLRREMSTSSRPLLANAALVAASTFVACAGASPSVTSITASPTPSAVLVPSVPLASARGPESVSASPPPAAEEEPDASSTSDDDNDDPGVLTLTDPEPKRPLPKAAWFIEVRGDGVDAIATRGCGKAKQPSIVYATYLEPHILLICADGTNDTDPDVTIGIPSLRGVGLTESGHSQFAFRDEGYEARAQLTVLITKFGPVNKAVEGSYITKVATADGSASKTFFGRFRLQHLPDDPSVVFP
jgi:hypothetical protein